MIKISLRASALCVLATAGFAASVSADIISFDLLGRSGAGMLAGNENPGSASGSGSGGEVGAGITYDTVTRVLTVNVGWGSGAGFSNLTGNITVAHIHATAGVGAAVFTTNGGVIINMDGATPGFNSSGTNGGWTNTQVTLSAAQEVQLFASQLYLNAHTSSNPGGELRGNLVQVPSPAAAALLGLGGVAAARRRR